MKSEQGYNELQNADSAIKNVTEMQMRGNELIGCKIEVRVGESSASLNQ